MRLATWNVNSVAARLPRLLEWLEAAKPDVLCLQEIKCTSSAFPSDACHELGYEVAAHGDGRWNGVALLSRIGLSDIEFGFQGQPGYGGDDESAESGTHDSADGAGSLLASERSGGGEAALFKADPVLEPRAVGADCGPLRVWSLYVPNGRSLGHSHYRYKLAWLEALRSALASSDRQSLPLAVCGDFNVAPHDEDVWDINDFDGSTHVSGAERRAVENLLELGLTDVMPRPLKYDRPYTYWDYRSGMFHKNKGMRIDLVCLDNRVAQSVADAYVDREARKGKGPSDHAPVVVDIDIST